MSVALAVFYCTFTPLRDDRVARVVDCVECHSSIIKPEFNLDLSKGNTIFYLPYSVLSPAISLVPFLPLSVLSPPISLGLFLPRLFCCQSCSHSVHTE